MPKSRLFVVLSLPLLVFGACADSEPVDLMASADEAVSAINEEVLKGHIAELSSDEYEGRGPGGVGDQKTQQYLAEQMEAIGLEPGGADGSWYQTFDIVGITSKAPETWTFRNGSRSLDLKFWDDAIPFGGLQEESVAIEDAELVFVGYGIQAPEYGWDDFKGQDLTGKVLVIMNNDPEWDADLFGGERRLYYGRWSYKYEKAAELGAAGAIVIHTTPSAGYPYQVVQTSWTGEQFELPTTGEPRVPVKAWVTEDAARELFAFAGHDLDALRESARSTDFEPVDLGIETSIEITNQVRTVQTANVLGQLRGRDPELSPRQVVFTAHHDHLGVGEPNDEGDAIYNGALDNASGTAGVLAMAQSYKNLPTPPRRSLLFAFVAAEEQGLLGSQFLAQNPPVPTGMMTANLNFDGANIWGRTSDVTYIGYGKSSLDAVVERHAAAQGRSVKPDQFPDKGYFYRSDQFNFAKVGVPALYLDPGTEYIGKPEGFGKETVEAWTATHYHQPSDELEDDWVYDGMIEDAKLGFMIGLDIAEADADPTWNAGDEFEAARLAALAELEDGESE